VTLSKENWQIPESFLLSDGEAIVPFFAGETVTWRLVQV
jgi:dihydroorotase